MKLTHWIVLFASAWGALSAPALCQEKAGTLRACLVSGSLEYESDASLRSLRHYLEKHYRITCSEAFRKADNDLPGLENLETCDVMVLFTRRLTISGEQLERVKQYCLAGKPIVGIRTASHGFQNWLELDKLVFGGNYKNHYKNASGTLIEYRPKASDHPILAGVKLSRSAGTLYRNSGLAKDVDVLLDGSFQSTDPNMAAVTEPIAWTRIYHEGRIFYTSLGHQNDFTDDNFLRMIANAIYWTTKQAPQKR